MAGDRRLTQLQASSGAQSTDIYPALAGYAGWTLHNNLPGWGGSWSNGRTFKCDSTEPVAAFFADPPLNPEPPRRHG